MTANSAGLPRHRVRSAREALDTLARRKGARSVESIHDLASPDVFETDDEVDAFIGHVRAERDANLA